MNPGPPQTSREASAWQVLGEVEDPEIPVLSVVDLGVIRQVSVNEIGAVVVGLSPTYSGCPATAVIRANVIAALTAAGFGPVSVVERLSPPWSSDWISAEGLRKLERSGIAPPVKAVTSPRHLRARAPAVSCPHCHANDTRETSAFGSTPCKALYRCDACLEPFEYFKCL